MAFNWDQKPLYNVIARIPGSTFPDEWIIRGNHHDAWVNGAADPVSGMSAELEEARALGELRKQGWSPKRTIVYAAWDGEEPGLLGSTEWVEAHADDLKEHAVVVHQHRRQRPRLSQRGRVAFAGTLRQRRGAGRDRSRDGHQRLEAAAGADHRPRHARGAQECARPGRSADRRARVRIGLLTVPPACRHRVAESRLRRGGRGRHLPFDLRRLLLLHAFPRHRLRVRTGARADRRHGGHPAGGQRRPAVRVHESRRHRREVREGAERAAEAEAGRRSASATSRFGRRLRGGRRSASSPAGAEAGGGPARDQLRAARERLNGADRQRPPLRTRVGIGPHRASPATPAPFARSTRGFEPPNCS